MIEIQGLLFNVEITRIYGMRYLRMRLKDNTIRVSCSKTVSDAEVYRFIKEKEEWIMKTYRKAELRKEASFLYRGGDVFYLFGKPYTLVFSVGNTSYRIKGDTIHLTYKENDKEKALHYLYKHLDKLLLEKADEYLEKYLFLLRDYGYRDTPEVRARILKSKWGVCYTRNNRIAVSSYLIHYPEKCLEYIILHEVTHFLVPNHSKRFYEIVKRYMPEYKEVLKQLK